MREQPAIRDETLSTCLLEQYGIAPRTIEFLALGLDYNAGVYRVVDTEGARYLLKVTTRALYEPSYRIPRYLYEQGIHEVVAPLVTRSGALWATLEGWRLVVYLFLDGDTSWGGMAEAEWERLGGVFKRIHGARIPDFGRELLRSEAFDANQYVEWVREFERLHLPGKSADSSAQQIVYTAWTKQQATMDGIIEALEKLAKVLQQRRHHYVICHADLHPANVLRDSAGRVFVLDWDEVMLAPRERDFIYMQEPFFRGYGEVEIDWAALTYYRFERVAQDLIECARSVWFRENWSEEAKIEAAEMFHDIIMAKVGGDIDEAYRTARHLPETFHSPQRPTE